MKLSAHRQKTQEIGKVLRELTRARDFEGKMLEQKVFSLWRKHLGTPLGTKTVPVSVSGGILKIYTEYPPYSTELLFHKQRIIAELNAELGQPVLTDLRIEVCHTRAATSGDTGGDGCASARDAGATRRKPDSRTRESATTGENKARIEQALADVTDTRLKTSLRQLFTTQSENRY